MTAYQLEPAGTGVLRPAPAVNRLVGRARSAAVDVLPWLAGSERCALAALLVIGAMPVSLIAVSTFGRFGLRDLAIHLLAPALVVVVGIVARRRGLAAVAGRALVAGAVATGCYDLSRFALLWLGVVDRDPIPHIGTALGLEPAWVYGYLWRYLGNGGGLAVTFFVLGRRGARAGAAYGVAVCAGLLATLVISPHAQEVLFPLGLATIVMATVGHLIYGIVLGTIAARFDPALPLQY